MYLLNEADATQYAPMHATVSAERSDPPKPNDEQ